MKLYSSNQHENFIKEHKRVELNVNIQINESSDNLFFKKIFWFKELFSFLECYLETSGP